MLETILPQEWNDLERACEQKEAAYPATDGNVKVNVRLLRKLMAVYLERPYAVPPGRQGEYADKNYENTRG